MTLEEAIIHCEEVANKYEGKADGWRICNRTKTIFYDNCHVKEAEEQCLICAQEHRQLASWLKELKVIHDEIDDMSDYDEIFIGYLRKKMKEVT